MQNEKEREILENGNSEEILKFYIPKFFGEIKEIKTEVNKVKTEVNKVKTEVNKIKTEVNKIKTEVNNIKKSVSFNNINQEFLGFFKFDLEKNSFGNGFFIQGSVLENNQIVLDKAGETTFFVTCWHVLKKASQFRSCGLFQNGKKEPIMKFKEKFNCFVLKVDEEKDLMKTINDIALIEIKNKEIKSDLEISDLDLLPFLEFRSYSIHKPDVVNSFGGKIDIVGKYDVIGLSGSVGGDSGSVCWLKDGKVKFILSGLPYRDESKFVYTERNAHKTNKIINAFLNLGEQMAYNLTGSSCYCRVDNLKDRTFIKKEYEAF